MTIELAVQWARSSSRSSNPAQAARRLVVVRQFARYCALVDPATEVPPVGLLGRIPRRRSTAPHLHRDGDGLRSCSRQAACGPEHGLRPVTYVVFFGLLVVHRSAAFRVLSPDDRRCRPRQWHPHHPRDQIPQVPAHPAPSDHDAGTGVATPINATRDTYAAPRSEYFFRTERSPRLTRHCRAGDIRPR